MTKAKDLPIFCRVMSRKRHDAELFAALDSLGVVRRYQRGEYLCLEGDESSHLFAIQSGIMRVERTTQQGREVLLALYGAGDIFGELGVLDGVPRSAAARVIDTVEARVIRANELNELLLNRPDVLLSLTRSITARLRELTDQLVQSGERSVSSRVASRLVAIIDRSEHVDATGEFSLKLPISQEELGQWAGLSRESTAKGLRELRELGILSTGRQRLEVHQVGRLRTIAAADT